MTIARLAKTTADFILLSTDTKPVLHISNAGYLCMESNTGNWFIWDGIAWQPYTRPAPAGGGGAVTIADGGAVTIGAKADAAQTDPTQTAGLVAILKGILTKLGGAAGFLKSVVTDPTSGLGAAVQVFHNADDVALGTANGLLTGGVAQVLNPKGTLDRARGTGSDAQPAAGIPSGSQQLAGPFLTTTFNGAVTSNANAQTVAVASSANAKVGEMMTTQDNVEIIEVLTVPDGTHINAIFKNNHANGQTLTWNHFNMARDATIGDQVGGTGVSPSATFLYNNIAANFELDRSANGEKDGASGLGTSVAAEYEWNSGGPLTNAGVASGLQFDRARNLQGKGTGTATQNAGGAAGATSITVSSAAAVNSLQAGQQIRIDRNTGTEESAYTATNYVPGTAAITLQSALQFTHTAAAVEWDIFASAGPGLNGFTPAGVGIEEEALYNPVDGKMYIERSATQDGVAGANVVMENPALWNGATFDRAQSDATGKQKVSLYGKGSGSAGDTSILTTAAGRVVMGATEAGGQDGFTNQLAFLYNLADQNRQLSIANSLFNGGSLLWDRARNNHEVTVLASAARTASINSADQTNYNARGVAVTVDITAWTAGSITVAIKYKDTLSGKYVTLLTSAALAAVATTALIVYPGVTVAANLAASQPLPRLWRVEVTAADATSITYSASAQYLS